MVWSKKQGQDDRLAANTANQKAQDDWAATPQDEAVKRGTTGEKRAKARTPDGEREVVKREPKKADK